jgi:hypothetical protein
MSIQRRLLALAVTALVGMPLAAAAKEVPQQWEIVNPAGTIEVKYAKLAPRLTTLEGKTVVLRWNGKQNGNNVLNRVAELLAKQVPSAKVVKLYEIDKSSNKIAGSIEESNRIAKEIKDLKADLVIASQAD